MKNCFTFLFLAVLINCSTSRTTCGGRIVPGAIVLRSHISRVEFKSAECASSPLTGNRYHSVIVTLRNVPVSYNYQLIVEKDGEQIARGSGGVASGYTLTTGYWGVLSVIITSDHTPPFDLYIIREIDGKRAEYRIENIL
jgi:hypothetical protein